VEPIEVWNRFGTGTVEPAKGRNRFRTGSGTGLEPVPEPVPKIHPLMMG